MNSPSPAIVTQRSAQALPRLALLLLCAAYVLPGLFGRDPWRNADLIAFAYMQRMAQGTTPWWAPTLGDLPAETALLPHWLGAWAIQCFPGVDAAVAARLPFAGLLVLTLTLIWWATYFLARTQAAQPVPFAFGGEAAPVDYARTLADGALLATIASLGLLQLGHEITPELVQLCAVAGVVWALAAAPFRHKMAPFAFGLALLSLASSGAPTVAALLGGVGLLSCTRSRLPAVRGLWPWMAVALGIAMVAATVTQAWTFRLTLSPQGSDWWGFTRLMIWFTWPVLPLSAWTLWRWRGHLSRRHISTPAAVGAVAFVATLATGGTDRALMLCLPGLAILAAFALPTLQRSLSAAVDWFSVFFFSVAATAIWVIYMAMQTGWPAQPMRNIARLAPHFTPSFSLPALMAAGVATLAWLWLVVWRTSHHRHPLWKSLVLPAGGVALAWLLSMTLLLPPLNHARSPYPLMALLKPWLPQGSCILAPGLGRAQVAALELAGDYVVHAATPNAENPQADCTLMLLQHRQTQPASVPSGWVELTTVQRPTDRHEHFTLLRKLP